MNYKTDTNKISVTYEGVSLRLPKKISNDVNKKYNLSKPYFIFVGSAYPHKNLDRLIEAIVYLNEQLGEESNLALSSSRGIFTKRLEKIIENYKAEKYVKLLGFVPDEDLALLYNNSVGLTYPTLMEGFGLPGLEAMASGTIVLTSDIPVLKEIYKNHAMYFNPFDYTAIAQSMQDALHLSASSRKKIISTGKKYVNNFDWRKMAEETLEIYEKSILDR